MKIIKNNTKLLIGIIIGVIITSGIGITIAYQITASQISYQDTDVANAITELYNLSETHCPQGYTCYKELSSNLREGDMVIYSINNQIERFYVAEANETVIKLLPEYNLTTIVNETTKPKQSPTASGTNFLYSCNAEISYPTYVYSAQNVNCDTDNISPIVEAYKQELINVGIPVNEIRLLTQEELSELVVTKNYSWSYNQKYWSGTALTGCVVWYANSSGSVNYDGCTATNKGVRPVIIISRSSI